MGQEVEDMRKLADKNRSKNVEEGKKLKKN